MRDPVARDIAKQLWTLVHRYNTLAKQHSEDVAFVTPHPNDDVLVDISNFH